jgi:hypothetical protein
LLFYLSGSIASANSANRCHYFYTGVKSEWLDQSPEWFWPSLKSFEQGLSRGDAQAKFERDLLGFPFRPDLNTDRKLVAATVKIFRGKMFNPVVVYSNGKKFLEMPPDQIPPKGYSVFEGVYPDQLYYGIIAKGSYPVGDITSDVKYFGFDVGEKTARHGLSHLGGLYENETYGLHLQMLSNHILASVNNMKDYNIRRKMAFFSESFWHPSPKQKAEISDFLDSLSEIVTRAELESSEITMAKIESLSDATLLELAHKVVAELPDLTPLGGGSRDYSEKQSFLDQITHYENIKPRGKKERGEISALTSRAKQGYDLLTGLSLRESLVAHQLRRGIQNNAPELIYSNLSQLLVQANALIKFEVSDWYEAVTQQDTDGAKKILKLVCRTKTFGRWSTVYQTFCY